MRRLVFTPWSLGLIGVLVMVAALARSVFATPPADSRFLFLGDTLLGDKAEVTLQEQGYSWAFANLPDFDEPDLTLINAEGPLTDRYEIPESAYYTEGSPIARYKITTSRGEVTRYIHRSSPLAAEALSMLGVDVATLGNNHALDQGAEGLQDTQEAFAAVGIQSIGAGMNAEEAAMPYVYDTEHGRVAFFSFGEVGGTAPDATAEVAGIRGLTLPNLDAAATAAQDADAQWTVAMVHWGNNYEAVLETQQVWARRLKDRGFDLIVGHGPHLAQGVSRLGNTPVLYSVGNFVFLTEGRYAEETPGFSLAATAVLGPRGFREIQLICLQTDNSIVQYQTRACSEEDAQRVLPQVAPGIVVSGSVGTLKW